MIRNQPPKGRGRARLPSGSFETRASTSPLHLVPDRTAKTGVKDYATGRLSSAYRSPRVWSWSVLLTSLLGFFVRPLSHGCGLHTARTGSVPPEQSYSEPGKPGSGGMTGAIWAEGTAGILAAQGSSAAASAFASSKAEEGPFRVASKVPRGDGKKLGLPILLRRPYMTDHPEAVRFPLGVDADLTDESFEAVERMSLEIARAVKRQQQRQRRREREEYRKGELRPPVEWKRGHPLATRLEDKHESGDGGAAIGAAGGRPEGQYKFTESFGTSYVQPEVRAAYSAAGDAVELDGGNKAPQDEETLPETIQLDGGGTGGRLIVGLTEITFPQIRKRSQNATEVEKGKTVEGFSHPREGLSSHLEQGDHKDGSVPNETGGHAGGWFGGTGNGSERGETLNHVEAVREANQRLRLDQLQELGIIKSVKVLENVGLVILEFRERISEEQIKETVKTLWQRNRSTWLIEPDSEIVFRGKDSFERGDFVPVVPTEGEKTAGGSQAEETLLEKASQTSEFLPEQEPELRPRQQQRPLTQEEMPRIRTYTSRKGRHGLFSASTRENSALNVVLTPDGRRDRDATLSRIRKKEDRLHRGGQAVPPKGGEGRPKNPVFHVRKPDVVEKEAAQAERIHMLRSGGRKPEDATETHVRDSRAAAGRQLQLIIPVPVARHAINPYDGAASFTNGHTGQAINEAGEGSDEARQHTLREAASPGATRRVSYETAPSLEDATRAALFAPAAAEGVFSDGSFHDGPPAAKNPIPMAPYTKRHTSLLKPHMGIVPISLYDAAQEAVREALGEDAAFRSLEIPSSKTSSCEDCLEALTACERRVQLAESGGSGSTLYDNTSYKPSSGAIRSSPTPATRSNEKSGHTCAREDSSSSTLHDQTKAETRWQTLTDGTEGADVVSGEQATSGRPGAVAAGNAAPADETSDAERAPALQAKRGAAGVEDDPSDPRTGNTTHRRLILTSPGGQKYLPNDQYFSRQWAYQRPRVNVHAVEAWNLVYRHRLTSNQRREVVKRRAKLAEQRAAPSPAPAAKAKPIVVAVIDTGIDYTHEDLRTQMWVNEGEIPGNGVDDDGNGYVDDYRGYDFERDRSDPMDLNGHGTHVAGIIAAAANNRRGITGIAAMVWAAKPTMTAAEVRDCIVRTSTRLRSLDGFVLAGNVNAYAAVLDVLGPPKDPSREKTEEKLLDPVLPGGTQALVSHVSATSATAAALNHSLYPQPQTIGATGVNIFPSEEAFFQHISETLPYYLPSPAVAEHSRAAPKSSATAEAKNQQNTDANPVAAASASSLVLSGLTSLLGPLNKFLLLN